MAEATERPAGSGGEATSAAAGPPPGEGAIREGLPPGLPQPETYQPLSLLALAGFVLAVLYAAVMAVCAATALFNRSPLLLPLGLFVLPLAAAAVSWVARNRIRDSEGTLGGARLASWGVGLSVIGGLLYGAYYTATYLAVRQQAVAFGDEWFELLKKGDLDRAYRLTVRPSLRPADDPELHNVLLLDFDSEGPGRGVPYSAFRRSDLVHMLQRGGPESRYQPVGVVSWDFDKGAYQVQVRYRVNTPEMLSEVVVHTIGSEAAAGEFEGRQWNVQAGPTLPQPPQLTALGDQRVRQGGEAHSFAEGWMGQVSGGDGARAWLGTLPPDEREAALAALAADSFPALTGPALLGATDNRSRERAAGYRAFERGGILRTGKEFWASAKLRGDIEQGVRQMFQPGAERRPARFSLHTNTRIPGWEEVTVELPGGLKQEVARVLFDGYILLMDTGMTAPQYVVEAQVEVESDADSVRQERPNWRVAAVKLLSGRTAPKGMTTPGGPRRMQAPPPGN
jgi:hypothetical protein